LPFLKHLTTWATRNPKIPIELWIAGDGPLRRDIESFPAPANVSITFLGDVEYSKLPEVYAECGILAFPTLADEWGLVVVEAMASGLPVLGSLYSQAVEDLVDDGINGWTFRSDHENEVSAALELALSTEASQLDEMGLRARNKIRNFTPAVMAGQIADVVDYALKAARS